MRWTVSALVLMTLLVAPSAGAQTGQPSVSLDAKPSGVRLVPEIGVEEVIIKADVACPPGFVATGATRVQFKVTQQPTYATVVLNPAIEHVQFNPDECLVLGSMRQLTTMARVTTTREAPAFQDGQYQVVAHLTQEGMLGSTSARAIADFTIKNDYVGDVQVLPLATFGQIRPYGKVPLPFEVTNLGNGPSKTVVEVSPIGSNQLESVNAIPEIRLESMAVNGLRAAYKATRNIEITAGSGEGIYRFVATFRSAYDGPDATHTEESVSIEYSVLVTNAIEASGSPLGMEPLPAPAPMTPIIGLLLLGVAAWRRRHVW